MNNRVKIFIKLAVLAVFILSFGVSLVGAAPSDNAGTTLQYASKTATGYWERVWDWSITKTVNKPIIDMFVNDGDTAMYTVILTKTEGASRYYVEGEICVTNGGERATKNLKIVDNIQSKSAGDQWTTFYTEIVDVSSKPVLEPGEEGCYPYSIEFPGTPGEKYRNEALITITNHSGWMGEEFGTQDRIEFTIPTSPNSEVNATINVQDVSDAGTVIYGPFSGSQPLNYSRTFECNADEGNHPNTATIIYEDGTPGPSASASVDVNCYELTVTKDATPEFTRTWSWTVDKTGEKDSLVLEEGQVYLGFAYQVIVNGTSVDSDHYVSGNIYIDNPAPIPANLTNIVDLYDGSLNLPVTCPDMVVAGYQKMTCSYEGAVGGSGTNVATATLQNYYNGMLGGTTDFSGSIGVSFVTPTTVIDECVNVDDSIVGYLGQVCASVNDTSYTSEPFKYTADIGPYDVCGDYRVENIATATTTDTGTITDDNHIVDIYIPCQGGCTLTQGYWRTHSMYGPAPYDDTWALLGEDEPFYLSGQTNYAVMWTPSKGNAYYNLARQYIAAILNGLNEADTAVITQELADAKALFEKYEPAEVGEWKGGKGDRKEFIKLSETLTNYNEGRLGIPHCDEDSNSDNSE